MQRNNPAFLLILWLLASACSSKVVSGGNSSGATTNDNSTTSQSSNSSFPKKNTDEDLSLYRPKFKSSTDTESNSQSNSSQPVQASKTPLSDMPLHVNKKLDAILDTIAMRNKSIKFTNGFRIQIYVGNDRKAADDAKIYTYQKYPEIFPYLSYQQPIYKVKIGDFLNRMDAERYYADLKELYPSAMILPDRVEIKKGIMVK
ncbi:sporulation related protein [Arcicella aurantiaca]|uniref:Sporulation related protein n=1 Tax=Arcicella aurantiaca TaxID=591202 RepID=A0A316E738_9BACT|nr:SPOR domain-containing protein [Arcicella aurantiaca]PWK26221.1 sporulation related protein [Arcicella aurantiaca]